MIFWYIYIYMCVYVYIYIIYPYVYLNIYIQIYLCTNWSIHYIIDIRHILQARTLEIAPAVTMRSWRWWRPRTSRHPSWGMEHDNGKLIGDTSTMGILWRFNHQQDLVEFNGNLIVNGFVSGKILTGKLPYFMGKSQGSLKPIHWWWKVWDFLPSRDRFLLMVYTV